MAIIILCLLCHHTNVSVSVSLTERKYLARQTLKFYSLPANCTLGVLSPPTPPFSRPLHPPDCVVIASDCAIQQKSAHIMKAVIKSWPGHHISRLEVQALLFHLGFWGIFAHTKCPFLINTLTI